MSDKEFKSVMNERESGALGSGISGSGPSIFALSKGDITAKKVADAMTRYLIGDRKQAVRQLAMLASKINVDIDQDNYNSQYSDTHRAILRVLKRMM